MTKIDQRHQHVTYQHNVVGNSVTYQYNAAGNIDIGVAQNKLELINELKKIQKELTTAAKHKALDNDSAIDAEYQLKKAVSQAEKTTPEKPALIEHLSKTKELVSGVSGLAGAIGQAIETTCYIAIIRANHQKV